MVRMIIITNQNNLSLQLILYTLVLLLVCTRAAFGEAETNCIERERQALLIFKQGLTDGLGSLASWRSEEDCCEWRGVSCSNRTGHVVALDLQLNELRGNITSSLLVLKHLNYLDLSGNDFGGIQIPEFIGSLTKLSFLDLSSANFAGKVPSQLGNLTNLQYLYIGNLNDPYFQTINDVHLGRLEWLSHLHKLKNLNLDSLDLGEAIDWVQVIIGLPSLRELNLSNSTLPTIDYHQSHSFVNSSVSLAHLHLSGCNLSNSAYLWLSKISKILVHLELDENHFEGPIPSYVFRNMTSLVHLDLSSNQITGISKSFGDICSLKTLTMVRNNLTGLLPDLFFNLSGCAKKSLKGLKLDDNMLSGSLPDITEFSSLEELSISGNRLDGSFPKEFKQPSPLAELHLSVNQLWGPLPDLSVFPLLKSLDIPWNRLNGTVSQGLGQLSRLVQLNLRSNSLQGMITEAHLSNLSELKTLDFTYNSLVLNFSPDWIPPFHLSEILLSGCTLGPHFPKWFRNQKNYSEFDISNARISDSVPDWFWNNIPIEGLSYFNLSYNQMKGKVPDVSSLIMGDIDLSSNCFDGSLPPALFNASSLFLSKNKFSGSISFLCKTTLASLWFIDLSDNQLSGGIPDCLSFWENLNYLNLANNNFSGRIPDLIDTSGNMRSLHLENNNLTGELPSSLKNCTILKVIDLENNKISGSIPSWIGVLDLVILSLRSNHINGDLPPQLCNLRNVQVLDIADNNISGTIPKCLNNLTAIVQRESTFPTIPFHGGTSKYRGAIVLTNDRSDEAWLVWKGIKSEYKNILGLVKIIDLSSNKLSGKIPEEITSLVGLLSLNLSRNNLTGPIPLKIGALNLLNALDERFWVAQRKRPSDWTLKFFSQNVLGSWLSRC